jgi:hypothetical protein
MNKIKKLIGRTQCDHIFAVAGKYDELDVKGKSLVVTYKYVCIHCGKKKTERKRFKTPIFAERGMQDANS